MQTIYDLVRRMENDYTSGQPTQTSKYVSYDMYEDLSKTDAYLNSIHISGDKDSKGRDKPFFNIVRSAVNIWYRATDIDRSWIKIIARKSSLALLAIIGNVFIQDFMRKIGFGAVLNKWGWILAKYGSAVLKFVEKDGELIIEVVDWNKIICDQIDFASNPKIEKLYLTPAQLRQRESYDQDQVEALIDASVNRENLDGSKKDNIAGYIPVYEIHGNLEKSMLTGKEKDENEYVQQMQVISFVQNKKDGFDDFVLYKGKEKQDPYMLTHLIEEDAKTLSTGAVKSLFEAQWMMNHTAKQMKDNLDLASKLIWQTSDGNFVGRNVLDSLDNGSILIHDINKPITQVNNVSNSIAQIQSYANQWKVLANEQVSISDAMRGEVKSGSAWRQTEAVLQESHSLFELMTENKGLYIQEMFKRFIFPYMKKQLSKKDEISGILNDIDIQKIDARYVPRAVQKVLARSLIPKLLSGEPVTPDIVAQMQQEAQTQVGQQMQELGAMRSFTPDELGKLTWKDIFEDLDWENSLEVDVTGEGVNTQEALTTLSTVLKTISGNPNILQDPNAKMLFNKIIAETGVLSPVEIIPTNLPQPSSGGQQVGGDLTKLGEKINEIQR